MRQRDQFQTSYLFFKKASCLQHSFNILRQSSIQHTIRPLCIKLQSIDPEISSIQIFQERVWEEFLEHILCMIFQEKCVSCYILPTGNISLPDRLYFLRYWSKCVLQLFVNLVVTLQFLKLTLPLNEAVFFMTKKSKQKCKYLENEKSFKREIKSIFQHF